MKICKEAVTDAGCPLDETELELINALSRSPLKAEEVYTFAVCLCDNEVDRDSERFDIPALHSLAELFVGKSGIFDHQWSAKGQTARIYRTELVEDKALTTSAGEPYTCLKAYSYMVRTQANEDLIREIEGGIKKEVSVSCAVADTVCSICGNSLRDRERCVHTKGRWYGNQLCCGILRNPTDAYEWSFVAVPAQPKAGVVKGFRDNPGATLKEVLSDHPALLAQLERLEEESLLGRRYLSGLRKEVVRLGGLLEPGFDRKLRLSMTEKLGEEELLALKKSYEQRLEEKYPPISQLKRPAAPQKQADKDNPFLI